MTVVAFATEEPRRERPPEGIDLTRNWRAIASLTMRTNKLGCFEIEADQLRRKIWEAKQQLAKLTAMYPKVPDAMVDLQRDKVNRIPKETGVYFVWAIPPGMWDKRYVAYVGEAINLFQRVRLGHEAIRKGDWVSYLLFKPEERMFAESYYIGVTRPERNFGNQQRRVSVPLHSRTY